MQAPNAVAAIQQLTLEIDSQVSDIEILLGAVFDKIDLMDGLTPSAAGALNAINCFTTCALRNAALVREARDQIAALVLEGGVA